VLVHLNLCEGSIDEDCRSPIVYRRVIPFFLVGLLIIWPLLGAKFPTQTEPTTHRLGQHGSWQYRAAVDPTGQRIIANATYALGSVAQVGNFEVTQRQLAHELIATTLTTLDVTIVFRHPLTQAAFEHFITSYALNVSDYTLRYVDNHGERVTIGGSPSDGELVPKNTLNFILEHLQQRSPGALLGWIEVRTTVPAHVYEAIISNDEVYFVDVSRSVVRAAFNNDGTTTKLPIELSTPQFYWNLENLHLVPQKK
jgi:hypothetical protein